MANYVTFEVKVRTVIYRTVRVTVDAEREDPIGRALDRVDELNLRVPRAGLIYMRDEAQGQRVANG